MYSKNETVLEGNQNVSVANTTPYKERKRRQEERDRLELEKLEKERQQNLSQEVEEEDESDTQSTEEDESGSDEFVDTDSMDGDLETAEIESTEETTEENGEEVETKSRKNVDWEKRYKDLQREFTKRNQRIKELENGQEKRSVAQATEEDVKNWIEKYPAIASIVQRIAVESNEDLRSEMEKLSDMRHEAMMAKAEAEVAKVHPDYKELRDSKAFHAWVDRKPQWVKNALYEDVEDTDSIVEIISMYKSSTDFKPAKTKKTKAGNDAARNVSSRGSNHVKPKTTEKKYEFTESQIRQMSQKEFEDNFDKIEQAQKEGKILLDLQAARM